MYLNYEKHLDGSIFFPSLSLVYAKYKYLFLQKKSSVKLLEMSFKMTYVYLSTSYFFFSLVQNNTTKNLLLQSN